MALRRCINYDQCGNLSTSYRCEPCRLQHNRGRDRARVRDRPTSTQRGYTTEYHRNRELLLAASDVCWLCGHAGAKQADHVIPTSRGGTSALGNLRPAHGTAAGVDNPCPTCGRRCNQERGSGVRHTG